MSGKLTILRDRLQTLQTRRAAVRWGEAACALVLVMLAGWAAAFLCDWSLRLPFAIRALVLIGWLAALVWAVRRHVWPAVTQRETVEDLALIVERRHQIDSDLIGALQFESAAATATANPWGSPRLTTAVIDYVAEFSPSLNVFEGFTYEKLPRRLTILGSVLLMILIASVVFPAEVSAFWNRFWLGSGRYPSRTVISELIVNQQPIAVIFDGQPRTINVPQGTSLVVELVCTGELPPRGSVRLKSLGDGAETEFELKPAGEDRPGRYQVEHPLPSSDFTLQAFAGDTWSDPLTVRVVLLPVVDAVWTVTPPSYAAAADPTAPSATARYLSLLEGSRLQLSVRGTNKRLAKVELHWDDSVIPLVTTDQEATWTLPADSPLSAVRSSGSYELHVVDVDDLSLTPPIAGSIRLKPDRAPRVVSGVLTKLVMPTAKPKLVFAATDDYGLSEIRLEVEIQREAGESVTQTKSLKRMTDGGAPLPAVYRDEVRLDLSPYKLEKGDELRLTVEAVDARGGLEPKAGRSEPLVLKVTDRSGILAGLNESDQVTVKQLDAIIQRELGIGGDKR